MTKFVKVFDLFKMYGLSYAISVIINRLLGIIGIPSEIETIKTRVNKEIGFKFSNTIAYGVFKGMKMSDKVWWGKYDVASKILGQYESHVIDKIVQLSNECDTFIDIGAADGYFAIGAVKSELYSKSICFELSEIGQKVIIENSKLNDISDSVAVYGVATEDSIKDILSQNEKAVVLCDIEGAEFDVLTVGMLEVLKNCSIIIELHDTFTAGADNRREKLFDRAKNFFEISYLSRTNPDVYEFSELNYLNDNERFLIFSEGRPLNMEWVCFSPKL